MTYLLRYAPEAVRDMEAVWEGVYEASKNTSVADKYVNEFADAFAKRKEFPHSGIQLLYKGLFTGFYSVTFKKYKAFYRVNEKYIEVPRIIMAKGDYMEILFGESKEKHI